MSAAAQPRNDAPASPPESLRVTFCGLALASPVIMLSGCAGFGEEYTRVAGFSLRDVGAVCLAGTTAQPRTGHPPRRVLETPMGMINAVGLQNPGVDHVVAHLVPQLDREATRFVANVAGSSVGEFVEVARRFDDSPVDAIEIHLGCPDPGRGDAPFGADAELSARIVAACRAVTRKPLIAKLAAELPDTRLGARLCIDAGCDALAVAHGPPGLAIDVRRRRAVLGAVRGVVSGPAIRPIALLKVRDAWEVAKTHRIPIIGQGGIASAMDALEFLIAGATCVGIGTALFYDPLVCRKVNEGIAGHLAAQGLASVGEITGTLLS